MTTSGPVPGQVLAEKYRVDEVLGVGGMGAVVAAYHLQLDQRVAIKYLLPDALKNPEVVERFAREARAAAKIRSEHVARVIDVGRFDDGAPYIVMEFLEGRDLARQLATHGPLSVAEAVRCILEACEALAEAHTAKIVHRDLKPANLFLANRPDKRAIVKVLDFGISKVEGKDAALTNTTAMMGTAYYMSPEQMTTPKAVDHRSDIWSLGIILYELLSGQPPFLGETVAEVIAGILQNQPSPLASLRADVPPGLAAVIAQCMRSRVAERPSDVGELAEALAPFASPADRHSVDLIMRVLGTQPRASLVSPSPSSLGGTVRLQSAAGAATGPAPLAAAGMTSEGLSASAIVPLPTKRRRLAYVGGAIALFAVAASALVLRPPAKMLAEPGHGMVSAPPTEISTVTGLRRDVPPPAETAVPAASSPSATVAVTPAPTQAPVRAAAVAKPRLPAAPSAASAAVVVPVASASAPVTPPESSAPKANPLQMGIK